MNAFTAIRHLAVLTAFSAAGVTALPTGEIQSEQYAVPALPNGMQFEADLSIAQQTRIAEIVNTPHDVMMASSGSMCPAKAACYLASCWVPIAGIACLLCDLIHCPDTRRDVPSRFDTLSTLPNGMQFESGLSVEQQQRVVEIVTTPHDIKMASSGSMCPAKEACYLASCWVPVVGIACLLCDLIHCPDTRRDVVPSFDTFSTLPNGMQFEAGLSVEQQQRIVEIVSTPHDTMMASSGSMCPAKEACYLASCWVPVVGIACLLCDLIHCPDTRRDVHSFDTSFSTLPNGRQFEAGLSVEQQQRIVEIVSAPHDTMMASSGSMCPAKEACYLASCWVPVVGIACLLCDLIHCPDSRRDTRPSFATIPELPNGMQFEEGLDTAQQQRIAEIVNPSQDVMMASSGNMCPAKEACYLASCWVPFVGVACLLCDLIHCPDTRRDIGFEEPLKAPELPDGMLYEMKLPLDQKQPVAEIAPDAQDVADSERGVGSCPERQACLAWCKQSAFALDCMFCNYIPCYPVGGK